MKYILHDTGLCHLLQILFRHELPLTKPELSRWSHTKHEDIFQTAISEPSLRALKSSQASVSKHSDETLGHIECGVAGTFVTWYGGDDPENPMNFSDSKKAWICFEIFVLNSFIYLGSSIYSPGIDDVIREFGVSRFTATLGTSLGILGYATGPMFWSPLSEIPSIGRNTIYLGTLTVFLILQSPIALAQNIETILIFRFLTGFFGSPAQATGGATVADMYFSQKRSYGLGLWELSTWIGPTLGPLVGGFAAQARGWRWTMWEMLWINGPMLLIIFCFLPETSGANILYRRARRLRLSTGNEAFKCAEQVKSSHLSKKTMAYETLIRPFELCFQEPICILLNTYTALITGILFTWLESFPLVFGTVYGFNLGQTGLAFLGLLIGSVVAYVVFIVWFHYTQAKDLESCGPPRPEERFIPLMAGCAFIPACLFIFGWGAREDIHWMVPVFGSSLFSIGGFSLFISILNYLPDAYPQHISLVLAGNNFTRCTFGAGCVLFAHPMYEQLGCKWASTLLGVLGVVFVPVPFAFYFWGGRVRGGSRWAWKGEGRCG